MRRLERRSVPPDHWINEFRRRQHLRKRPGRRDRRHADQQRSDAGMRTAAKTQVAGISSCDVEGVWIDEVLRVSIRQCHFQDYAITLGNCHPRDLHGSIGSPHESMNRATITKQFLDGLWHQMWLGTKTLRVESDSPTGRATHLPRTPAESAKAHVLGRGESFTGASLVPFEVGIDLGVAFTPAAGVIRAQFRKIGRRSIFTQ